MQNSQWIASLIIENVLKGHNLDKSFQLILQKNGKTILERNQSQIKDLAYGALRFLGQSKFIINKLVKRKIENRSLEALLHIALFQINHERSNDFTIVDQAVNASKKIDPKKSAFVNAILRNFLRNKKIFNDQVFSDESARFNYLDWWISKIKEEYPNDWESILNIGNLHPPFSLRVNLKNINISDYKNILSNQGIDYFVLGEGALIFKKPMGVNKIPGFLEGNVSVQDYGAQLAAHILDLKENHNVLDVCAAPGGKSCHMLELKNIKLTSVEIDKARAKKIEENFNRENLVASVINAKVDINNIWWDKKLFDRILVDAPCSSSGIVRRHVDIKWLRRPSDLTYFSNIQFNLLVAAWPMLKTKGKLLYVTCSVFSDENIKVIERFKAKIKGVRELDISFPKNIKVINNQLIPTDLHDGLFYALLEKQ